MSDEAKRFFEDSVDLAERVSKNNIEVLFSKCRDVTNLLIEVLNDIINYWGILLEKRTFQALNSKSLMYPVLLNVVYSNVQYCLILLAHNATPQVFFSLRTALEGMVIALYADANPNPNVRDKTWALKIFEKSIREASIFKIKDCLRKILCEVFDEDKCNDFIELILDTYQLLSALVHPIAKIRVDKDRDIVAGQIGIMVGTLGSYGDFPGYAVLIPLSYNDIDLKLINEDLRTILLYLRLCLAVIMYAWLRKVADNLVDQEHVHSLYRKIINLKEQVDKLVQEVQNDNM